MTIAQLQEELAQSNSKRLVKKIEPNQILLEGESKYYSQQDVDDLEELTKSYQKILSDNIKLNECIREQEQTIADMKIEMVSYFGYNQKVADLTRELEKLKDSMAKQELLHQQELFERQNEFQEIQNRYDEFEIRLFEGVGHGLRVKDRELKIARLKDWKGKVEFGIDRQIVEMNKRL